MNIEIKTIKYTTYDDGSPLFGRDEDFKTDMSLYKGIKFKTKKDIATKVAIKTKTKLDEILNNYSSYIEEIYNTNTKLFLSKYIIEDISHTLICLNNLTKEIHYSKKPLYYSKPNQRHLTGRFSSLSSGFQNGILYTFNPKRNIVLYLSKELLEEDYINSIERYKNKGWDVKSIKIYYNLNKVFFKEMINNLQNTIYFFNHDNTLKKYKLSVIEINKSEFNNKVENFKALELKRYEVYQEMFFSKDRDHQKFNRLHQELKKMKIKITLN